eukprot:763669-Hanusia_phi.AAC.2
MASISRSYQSLIVCMAKRHLVKASVQKQKQAPSLGCSRSEGVQPRPCTPRPLDGRRSGQGRAGGGGDNVRGHWRGEETRARVDATFTKSVLHSPNEAPSQIAASPCERSQPSIRSPQLTVVVARSCSSAGDTPDERDPSNRLHQLDSDLPLFCCRGTSLRNLPQEKWFEQRKRALPLLPGAA